jgi:hypothetical protein
MEGRMTDQLKQTMRRWLLAERSGTVAAADRALRDLFSVLVDPAPSAGFADRVMLRLAPMPEAGRLALGWRLTLAACLVVAALSVAYLPLVVWPLAEFVRVGGLVQLLGTALAAASRALVDWLSFWQSLAGVNIVLMTVISKPSVAAMLFAVAVLTAISFRILSGLMVAKRSPYHG